MKKASFGFIFTALMVISELKGLEHVLTLMILTMSVHHGGNDK